MIFVYSFVLVLLGAAKALAVFRARGLERRYAKAALAAEKLMQAQPKPGNGRLDVAAGAKRQYQLGQLVQKRDALETKHAGWQTLADRLTAWTTAVRNWRGRKLPYTAGVIDVWMVTSLNHFAGGFAGRVMADLERWLSAAVN